MLEIILETLLDGIKLIPFLFIAFFIIELLEHKLTNKSKEIIGKSGKFGPIIGSLLGLIPQCGFSVMATNLYVTRIISLGTLIGIYLSTSDEMLPILLSENVEPLVIIKLLGSKFVIGMIYGIIIDIILRKKKKDETINYSICEEEHCNCSCTNGKGGVLKPAIKHTFNTFIFIIGISFVINVLLEFVGEEYLSKIFLKDTIWGPFVTSLIGLIPNCGASVMITELYLNNAISFAATISGLLTGSGVAIIVLFKTNKNMKENFSILGILYFLGSITGLLIEVVRMILNGNG